MHAIVQIDVNHIRSKLEKQKANSSERWHALVIHKH